MNNAKLTKITLFAMMIALILALTGCGSSSPAAGGGGTGGGGTAAGAPFIFADIDKIIINPLTTPTTQYKFTTTIFAGGGMIPGAPITTATISLNGVNIPYIASMSAYSYIGTAITNVGKTYDLSITVNGITYTASGDEYTNDPGFTNPVVSYVGVGGIAHPFNMTATAANTVVWSAVTPATKVQGYRLLLVQVGVMGVLYPVIANTTLVTHPLAAISDIIPANTTAAGSMYLISVEPIQSIAIPGTASGSMFFVFDNTNPNSNFFINAF